MGDSLFRSRGNDDVHEGHNRRAPALARLLCRSKLGARGARTDFSGRLPAGRCMAKSLKNFLKARKKFSPKRTRTPIVQREKAMPYCDAHDGGKHRPCIGPGCSWFDAKQQLKESKAGAHQRIRSPHRVVARGPLLSLLRCIATRPLVPPRARAQRAASARAQATSRSRAASSRRRRTCKTHA